MNRVDRAIPDSDHVSRYCSPRTLENGLPTFKAFELREGDDYLSVNWLEYFGKRTTEENIGEVRKVFVQKGFNVRRSGRFVILHVGSVRSELGNIVRFEHRPERDDQSHSAMAGFASIEQKACLILSSMVHEGLVYEAIV